MKNKTLRRDYRKLFKEALKIMKIVSPYLRSQTDITIEGMVVKTESQRLREKADWLDRKESAVNEFRNFLNKYCES